MELGETPAVTTGSVEPWIEVVPVAIGVSVAEELVWLKPRMAPTRPAAMVDAEVVTTSKPAT